MDDEKRWQDMDSEEQAKRITELEHRIETLEAKIKAMERRKQRKDF
jgi:chaperonin cofactor prefoldin